MKTGIKLGIVGIVLSLSIQSPTVKAEMGSAIAGGIIGGLSLATGLTWLSSSHRPGSVSGQKLIIAPELKRDIASYYVSGNHEMTALLQEAISDMKAKVPELDGRSDDEVVGLILTLDQE